MPGCTVCAVVNLPYWVVVPYWNAQAESGYVTWKEPLSVAEVAVTAVAPPLVTVAVRAAERRADGDQRDHGGAGGQGDRSVSHPDHDRQHKLDYVDCCQHGSSATG